MRASLYIHIPFCARKCLYCDFESYAGRLAHADEYITRVIEEAKTYHVESVPTAFIGGGTPSLLEPEQLKRLLSGVFEALPPEKGAEITMEANPGTVTREKLMMARELGMNRVSFGVQAAQPRLLETLGRIHTFDEAEASVRLAQDCGITNVNCDVMYALPGQTADDLIETVDRIAGLGVTHISCYSLILEEGTRLNDLVNRGELRVPDEDTVCAMQDVLLKELGKLGFERYEISNYANPGFECRHNIVYWTGGNYLGLGCAAHSYMEGERFSDPDFGRYMAGETHIEPEFVDAGGRCEEMVLLGTRMTRGVRLSDFGSPYAERLIKEASKPMYKGLLEVKDGFLRCTDAGLMVHNALVVNLAEAISD